MNLTTITEPPFEPVSLQDCYSHLRITPSGSPAEHPDDVMLTRHIRTARRDVERITNRSLVRQQLRLSAPGFCNLRLLRPPLVSVASVEYYDSANVLQSISGSDWYVTDDQLPQLRLVDAASWPSLYYARADAVRVNYWTGYPVDGSPGTDRDEFIANVPSEARDAILLGVELLYVAMSPDQREKIENARDALLSGLKLTVLA